MTEITEAWQGFWRERPGQRFAQRYARQRRRHAGPLRRAARMATGVVLVIVGVIFLPLPGPGFVPILLGGAMLAGESLRIARALDRAELRVRHWLRRD
jgi:uncharacterized protein (TIGR02611 family)